MADRQVTRSRKDRDGDILALCNPGQLWSPRQKRNAISDIENRTHSYFVNVSGVGRVDIHVVRGRTASTSAPTRIGPPATTSTTCPTADRSRAFSRSFRHALQSRQDRIPPRQQEPR